MKKFWRSGMIDKKVVAEREREEYINKLQKTILEMSRKPPEPEPKYAIVHTSDNRSHKVKIADDYDEVRVGDNVMLDFGGQPIIVAPKEHLKNSMINTATESKDPLLDIVDNYKNNVVGKPMSAVEANNDFRETMVAFAKEANNAFRETTVAFAKEVNKMYGE